MPIVIILMHAQLVCLAKMINISSFIMAYTTPYTQLSPYAIIIQWSWINVEPGAVLWVKQVSAPPDIELKYLLYPLREKMHDSTQLKL